MKDGSGPYPFCTQNKQFTLDSGHNHGCGTQENTKTLTDVYASLSADELVDFIDTLTHYAQDRANHD